MHLLRMPESNKMVTLRYHKEANFNLKQEISRIITVPQMRETVPTQVKCVLVCLNEESRIWIWIIGVIETYFMKRVT